LIGVLEEGKEKERGGGEAFKFIAQKNRRVIES
jgi:hypothetical protein